MDGSRAGEGRGRDCGGAEGLNNGTHPGARMHKWAHSAPWKTAAQALRSQCSHMFYSAFSFLGPALPPFPENMPS